MYYHYRQNPGDGRPIGPVDVLVEASSPAEADALATRRAGIYFDGSDTGRDCECCGDRWSRAGGGSDVYEDLVTAFEEIIAYNASSYKEIAESVPLVVYGS